MDGIVAELSLSDELLVVAAKQLHGTARRVFLGQVCQKLCEGNTRIAENRFGWGRETIALGIAEQDPAYEAPQKIERRGQPRSEDRNPQLSIDIRLIVEPHTHADPELKTDRLYANLSAAEVLEELKDRGYTDEMLPKVRTMRDILDRMNYRLKRIQKGKPLKKTEQTDAIFDNLKSVRAEYEDDPETLQISVDTKAKVSLGEYVQGGKNTDRPKR
jgi:Rhodopirellula transposase DDE domain